MRIYKQVLLLHFLIMALPSVIKKEPKVRLFLIGSGPQEEELKELTMKALKMKTDILMEEPCPIYEADESDWEDFWYNEDK